MLLVPEPAVIVPLVILHVYVAPAPALGTEAVLSVVPEHTDVAVVIVALGNGFIVTNVLPDDAWQPLLLFTLTDNVTEPDEPAVYVMLFVPEPAVIVPLLIIHAYVAPPPADGIEAIFPVVEAHTDAFVVIVALGKALTVTV